MNKLRRAKPAKPANPANPKIRLVFAGICLLTDGNRGGIFYPITNEQFEDGKLPAQLPDPRVFGWKVAGHCGQPGTIYEFESPPERVGQSIYADTQSFIGRLTADDRVIQWQAEHQATTLRLEAESREKAEKRTDLVKEQLTPLRIAYRSMVPRQRAAFLTQIMIFLTCKSS